jgi:methylisocitrate lyase
MTWFDNDGSETAPPGDRLAELWRGPEILQIPGAHNALAGLLAKRAGF